MRELSWHDLQWCLRRTPHAVMELLKEKPSEVFLAGGFIRACITNEHISDLDLFVPSKDAATLAAAFLLRKIKGATSTDTKNAITVHGAKIPIQIIHRWTYTRPDDLMRSFDFTIAMAGFWWDKGEEILDTAKDGSFTVTLNIVEPQPGKWRSICHDRYYEDLAAKRLIYTSPIRNEDAGGSILRVLKFYQRGYRIPIDSLGAVIARLMSGVEVRDLTDQEHTAKIITGLLREVDPAIDPSHVAHLPAESCRERETIEE